MKLLFISNLFPDQQRPHLGLDNANLLHALKDRCEVRVMAPRPSLAAGFQRRRPPWSPRKADRDFQPIYVPVWYVPKVGSKWNHLLMGRGLRKPFEDLRAGFDFDAVLCSWMYPDGSATASLMQDVDRRLVLVAQGSDVHSYLGNPFRRVAILAACRRADAVVTRSADLARRLQSAGADGERLHTVYNGVDQSLFHPGDAMQARRTLGIDEGCAVILFVGNFYEVKDPLLLVETHERVRRQLDRQVLLVMVGDGHLKRKIIQLAERLGTSSDLLLAGRRSSEEIARFMQAADLLCVPSRNEGVPNVILEAFASGLPVVATDVGGIREVHSEGLLGDLVTLRSVESLARALTAQLEKGAEKERIALQGGRYTWAAAAQSYLDLLRAG